ncbi:MAG: 30S ribosomal protein S2 [Candidatus Nanoarchaeia archaeon]|nr:30S ribosomal protein S2 [Candidatus Nanoarchaeia archaeon]MDD5054460.1 30S ribosomal protein S2 [Candidatus Nanoarchaeia archaeon]MDD5499566.1 30S ribosomal protein S2 [Candidatus Nanoarchaeia archaeon]
MAIKKQAKPKKDESEVKENIQSQLLVPLDLYLKAGIHIGTKFKNKSIEEFIFKTKQNGLKIMDIEKINEKILLAAKLLSDYEPGEIILVCRRETGHKPVKKLAEITGMRCITGRYLPGTITNPEFSFFTEPKIMIVADPWHDKQAIKGAILSNIPVIGLLGTNNSTEYVDFAIPCNNKSKKSLPLVYYLLGREYLKLKGIIKSDEEYNFTLEDFTDENL